MVIKYLDQNTLKEAIKLKVDCFQEELAGKLTLSLNYEEEYAFYLEWMQKEKEHQDKRTLLGAFKDDVLVGTIFVSYAENGDDPNACEINGLFVDLNYRKKRIAINLMKEALNHYLDKENVIIYNHKYAPSNRFFKALGAKVYREDFQENGKLHVEVLKVSLKELLVNLINKL